MDQHPSKRLRELWNQSSLTQQEAADQLGVSQSAISQYLRGTIPLNTGAVIAFASLFEIDPTEIDPDFFTPNLKGKQP